MKIRYCKRCKIFHEFSDWQLDWQKNDQRFYLSCKYARDEYAKDNREQILKYKKEYSKRHYAENKHYHQEYNRTKRKNKNEYQRTYYRANKEQMAKLNKHYAERPTFFVTYADKLNFVESIRNNNSFLEVKCAYCGKWYLPTRKSVVARTRSLEGQVEGENRLYCSRGCKHECSIYRQIKYPKDFKPATAREVQPELRQMVFERDGHQCSLCDSAKSLHCHHITGVEQNPIESADADNCITLCKACHKYVHSKHGCTYSDLKCRKAVGY